MALRFLHRDMVIHLVLLLLRTQRLPLRAVSSHATSFLPFCIFSYIIPHRVKGYFYDLPSFFYFFIKFLYPTTPFYSIGRIFTSLDLTPSAFKPHPLKSPLRPRRGERPKPHPPTPFSDFREGGNNQSRSLPVLNMG